MPPWKNWPVRQLGIEWRDNLYNTKDGIINKFDQEQTFLCKKSKFVPF